MRYFRRPWDESRGDDYESWGTSTWLFEVGEDAYPARQLELYENGTALKYDLSHTNDQYGGLGDQPLDLEDFETFEITAREFEEAWRVAKAINRPAAT